MGPLRRKQAEIGQKWHFPSGNTIFLGHRKLFFMLSCIFISLNHRWLGGSMLASHAKGPRFNPGSQQIIFLQSRENSTFIIFSLSENSYCKLWQYKGNNMILGNIWFHCELCLDLSFCILTFFQKNQISKVLIL